jgi:hypothetical protein
MSQSQKVVELRNRSKILQFDSVANSTKGQYVYGWNLYQAFCTTVLECSPFLTNRYQGYIQEGSVPYGTDVMIFFYTWMCFDMKISAGTGASYISAVRFMLQNCGVGVSSIFDHSLLASTKTGAELRYRSEHPVRDSHKLPMTCSMILRSRKYVSSDVKGKMAMVAMELAFVGLLRISEYIDTKKKNVKQHFIRGGDVLFHFRNSTTGATRTIRAPDAWKEKTSAKVQSMTFTVPSAKNDAYGTGYRFSFDSTDTSQPDIAFCIVTDMYDLARETQPTLSDPFFSSKGTIQLDYDTMHQFIRRSAKNQGLDPTKYSPHSLRIGGATALAAQQVPDSTIQTLGRWKSLAFLQYIRVSTMMLQIALRKMVDPNSVTDTDIVYLHPAGDRLGW